MKRSIRYRAGYKYQLADSYSHHLPTAFDAQTFEHHWFTLAFGILTIRRGYAWDGPSGVTWDDDTGMRGSLVHDVLYQAMQEGLLRQSFKDAADRELQRVCKEDGMWSFRAWYWYRAVKRCGGQYAEKGSGRPALTCGVDA